MTGASSGGTPLHAAGPAVLEHVRRCPLCRSAPAARWRRATDWLHGTVSGRLPYRRCPRCGARFLARRPAERAAPAFYPDSYAPHGAGAAAPAEPGPVWAQQLLARMRSTLRSGWHETLSAFYRPARPGLELLDFGCGGGTFLDWAREQGWRAAGVDVSQQAVRRVRARGHAAWPLVPGVWDELARRRFHRIRLNHVVEHLYRPRETLSRLFDLLPPGGAIHIAMPNPAGLSAQLFRSRWYGLAECPRHVILYPPQTISELCASLGGRRPRVLHEPVTKDFARSLALALARSGPPLWQRVEPLREHAGLACVAYAPAWLAARLGHGDRYHLLWEKPA